MSTSGITPHTKCAIFGGTFDPVHKGHMHVIDTVLNYTDYTHLFCVPTFHNPLKSFNPTASTEERLAMLSIACAPYSHVTVLDHELSAKSTSTIDTVRHIVRTYRLAHTPGLIVGKDVVEELAHWKDIETLQRLVTLVVISRPRVHVHKKDTQFLKNFDVVHIDKITLVDIQASALRKDRSLLKNSVPSEVWNYIRTRELYR